MTRAKKAIPTWIDVKEKLADFDRAGLLGLVQDWLRVECAMPDFAQRKVWFAEHGIKVEGI